jgi:uncharacterized protein (DUF2384 family)
MSFLDVMEVFSPDYKKQICNLWRVWMLQLMTDKFLSDQEKKRYLARPRPALNSALRGFDYVPFSTCVRVFLVFLFN